MSLSTWINQFVRDLTHPKRIDVVHPLRPLTDADVARAFITRAVIAQVLSGDDSTFTDKAVFVLGPVAVNAAAEWGAREGVRELNQRNSQPWNGVVDV